MTFTTSGASRSGTKTGMFRIRVARKTALLCACAAAMALAPLPAHAAEHALAGLRIFEPVKQVLAKYGTPTQILTDAASIAGAGTMSGGGSGMSGGGPGALPNFGGPNGAGGSPFGPRPGQFGGAGASMTPTDPTQPTGPTDILYVYKKPNGMSIDVLLSPDGRVIQITLLGYKSAFKTARGVGLGSGYGTVITKYNYPESQTTDNSVLTMTYLQDQHCVFQLKDNKVVGITVAAIQ